MFPLMLKKNLLKLPKPLKMEILLNIKKNSRMLKNY
jgi:hypothetical protein